MEHSAFITNLAGALAGGINIACVVLILAEFPMALSVPKTLRSPAFSKAIRFVGVTLVAMVVPIFLAETSKEHQFWPGHPGFPSGHTTFAASACGAIAAYRGPWWWLVCLPLTLLMMAALVIRRYHDVPDVIGGMILGIGLSTLIMRAMIPLIRANIPEPVSVPVQE